MLKNALKTVAVFLYATAADTTVVYFAPLVGAVRGAIRGAREEMGRAAAR
jgi:hypothetical protein